MLAISVEFLHGTFRGDPDGTAFTGGLAGESGHRRRHGFLPPWWRPMGPGRRHG